MWLFDFDDLVYILIKVGLKITSTEQDIADINLYEYSESDDEVDF